MDPVIETGCASNPKPPLAPKPRLTPKPFSLQKNNTIRSIHSPKTVTTTSKPTTKQTVKSEASVPKPTPTAHVQQTTTTDSKPSSLSKPVKDKPKITQESEASPHDEDTVDSSGGALGKSDPSSKSSPPKETHKPASFHKNDVTQPNHKADTDLISNAEQKDGKKKEDKTQSSVIQKPVESGSDDGSSTTDPLFRWGGTRKSLSTELTSKFESGGPSLPVQPTTTVSTNYTKADSTKAVSSKPEQSQITEEPSNKESDEGLKDDYIGGGSIKRRISLLFDSSSRPEVIAKKEEPEIVNSEGGVKERIKHWAMEASCEAPKSEKKPQVAPRPRSKSFEPIVVPAAEKTPKTPQVKPSATETSSPHTVDPHPKLSSPEPPSESTTETSKDSSPEIMALSTSRERPEEDEPTNPTKDEVQLRSHRLSATQAATNEADSSESVQRSLKRDNVKRRSVHFGIVESDDGGPPLILGSASESSSEEEEATEDKFEQDTPVSFPVYRRVGNLHKKEHETQNLEEERQKHLEFEQRRRAEEHDQARLKLEEEQKQEVEEREKETLRQEDLRLREQEKLREKERERERLAVEEMERLQKEEWERERLKLEKSEMIRQREEEMEKERQLDLMLERQREEERERVKQKEDKLRQEQMEREKERLEEEEKRKEDRLMVERERQRLREEERSINIHKEHIVERRPSEEEVNSEKQREDVGGKEWVKKTESLRREEEEKDREKEWELERARQKEERLKQGELEEERLREEAEERERKWQQRLKVEERMRERQRQEEEEERKRRVYERQMEHEKEEETERQMETQREEEKVRHMERERLLEVERKMQEELEIQRVKELEEKLRKEEREKEMLGFTDREQKSGADQGTLISFDSEDVPQMSETPTQSPIEVLYDDFSVKKSLIEVDFDDFSVKPKKWSSHAKAETSPDIESWATSPRDEEKVDMLVRRDVSSQENKAPEYVAQPDDPKPTPPVENPEEREEVEEDEEQEEEEEEQKTEEKTEEQQLISAVYEEAENEEDIKMEEEIVEKEEDDDDKQETQVNYHHSNGEDSDVGAFIDREPEEQNLGHEQTSEPDSLKFIPDQVPEVSSQDVDMTDFHREPELSPFPESSTSLLDTSAQKSKANLSKRRSRSRPSRSLRAGSAQRETLDWRTCDSTDGNETSCKQRVSNSEEENPKANIISSPSSSSQRVPVFPGLSPTALIAQLKKRTAGGGQETEEDKGREEGGSHLEETAPSLSVLSRSPRTAAHLAGAARVLPPLGGTDGGSSPAWLKELKSKKRLSQYDSEL